MEIEDYISQISAKFPLEQIKEVLDKLKYLKVLIVGDAIIDHYIFTQPKSRAVKDPILSVEYRYREVYAGGVLAVANHLSDFVGEVRLLTLLGDRKSQINFIQNSLPRNVELKLFTKENSPTTVKKRIIDYYRNNKLFKIEYINDKPINKKLSEEIIDYLDKELANSDLVVVADFGHGFINNEIRRKLEEKSKFLALNVQSNSANMGYNYFNLYSKFDFITMNEDELRLPLRQRFEDITKVTSKAIKLGYNNFIVTLGRDGCIYVKDKQIFSAPIVINSIVDTVGAGDALFAVSSLLSYINTEGQLIPFIANCAGGLATNMMGNKEPLTKDKLIKFIEELYSQ